MVPRPGGWEPFPSPLLEDVTEIVVLKGDGVRSTGRGFSFHDYPLLGGCLSREELGFGCVDGPQHDGELIMGDPPTGPVDFWLCCHKPGVPQDDFAVP